MFLFLIFLIIKHKSMVKDHYCCANQTLFWMMCTNFDIKQVQTIVTYSSWPYGYHFLPYVHQPKQNTKAEPFLVRLS